MNVIIEYAGNLEIGDALVPVYVTNESVVYVGCGIDEFLFDTKNIKQLIITDKDGRQYFVHLFVEVCKFTKPQYRDKLTLIGIGLKGHEEVPEEEPDEFMLMMKKAISTKVPRKKTKK